MTDLEGVGHCGGEHDHGDVAREHDDDLLPHHAALLVVEVVHLVKDDPLHVADQVRALVPRFIGQYRMITWPAGAGASSHVYIARDDSQRERPALTGVVWPRFQARPQYGHA